MDNHNVEMRMFPRPKSAVRGRGEMFFGRKLYLHIGQKHIDSDQMILFRELFSNFTGGLSSLKIILHDWESKTAVLSELHEFTQPSGEEWCSEDDYSLKIDAECAVLFFRDKAALSHGFCTLLSQLEVRDNTPVICTLPVCEIHDEPEIVMRCVHVCVFPETRYIMLKKFIRLIGFAKYSHVVLEFWGTFRYKCCRDLWGKGALTRRQIKELVREANALGVEVIPMLNVLGHAAQSRAIYAKHTTLDQNPKLMSLFEPDGWTWNILNPKTVSLLHAMCRELCDVCGKGSYFHIGCDESFPYGSSRRFDGRDKTEELYKYLNSLADELAALGRRAIMWGDQLLKDPQRFTPDCITYGETPEIAKNLTDNLDRRIIIADWQYYVTKPDIPTAQFFTEQGFDVILAPFDNVPAAGFCAEDVVNYHYFGFMQTTWHLMHGGSGWRIVLRGAALSWEGYSEMSKADTEFMGFETSSYLRRLLPSKGKYRDSGLREQQIEV